MKLFIIILLIVLAGESFAQVPKGWRIPAAAEINGQWSEEYWDRQCREAEELGKKSANDAVEYTGNPDIDKYKEAASKPDSKGECWKPEKFPVHTASGDYNGDGVPDEALILISTTRPLRTGFFVFLKAKTGPGRAILLDSIAGASPQDNYIGTQPPVEKLETWCNQSPDDCKPYDPKFITLKRDSIMFGTFEASTILAYWSASENKFKLVTISD